MSSKGKDKLKALMLAIGIDPERGELPEKWDMNIVTFQHYYNELNDAIGSGGHSEIADGTHAFTDLPVEPARIPEIGGGAAAGGADQETLADYNQRLTHFRFEHSRINDLNTEYKKGVTFIIEFVKKITTTTTYDSLRALANARDVTGLLEAFQLLGNTRNPQLGFSAEKDLDIADFTGKKIEVIYAVISRVYEIVDLHAEHPTHDLKKRVALLQKALDSDSKKFGHAVATIEQDLDTVITYEQTYMRLLQVQQQYNSRNLKDNVVNNTLIRYGSNADTIEANFANTSCIGCKKKDHNIPDCHSYYQCGADPQKAHHIKESCGSSRCSQPQDQLKRYMTFTQNAKKDRREKSLQNKVSTPAAKSAKTTNSESDEQQKPNKKQRIEKAHKAIENSANIEMVEELNSMKDKYSETLKEIRGTLKELVTHTKQNAANHTTLAEDVRQMGSNFNEYASMNSASYSGNQNANQIGLISGNHHGKRNINFGSAKSNNSRNNNSLNDYGEYDD